MPALYAHDRFGAKVFQKLDGELKEIISRYYTQFQIGLQGPDIFFFYRPYKSNRVTKYGNHLHQISAYPFFEHALKVVGRKGKDCAEYAYLMGFICHFILDSECHPYVDQMIKKSGVQHLEIEEEFEKYLLRLDKKDPFSYPLADLVPTDWNTAEAIAPFYQGISAETVKKSLAWLKGIKGLLTAPGKWKYGTINTVMKLSGKYAYLKGLMHQKKDNVKCAESTQGLMRRFHGATAIAAEMIRSFEKSLDGEEKLNRRFDRTFE